MKQKDYNISYQVVILIVDALTVFFLLQVLYNSLIYSIDFAGIATFEMEYERWVEVQTRQNFELRSALNTHLADIELRMLVDSVMNHYFDLFRMKANAAKADVFYLMSGMWKTSAERFFMWIGGFRPSELLKVMLC